MSDDDVTNECEEAIEEEKATLEDQFYSFAAMLDPERSGKTITLYRSDYWMRQAKVLDDRKLTMTDTGVEFNKFSKTELEFAEWQRFLSDVCAGRGLGLVGVQTALSECGLPGQHPAPVPRYRDYFLTWRNKRALINVEI